jgi:hypothetical protein
LAVFGLYLACALDGLRRLERASGPVAEQVVIGAIAHVGRGMGVTLLAHFSMLTNGWAPPGRAIVTLVIAALFTAVYASTRARRDAAVAIRPY